MLTLTILSNNCSSAAKVKTDLPKLFRKYYELTENDFDLDYQRDGRATYKIRGVFESDFLLEMSEELTVYDTKPNAEIEMCNGTVTDLNSGEQGRERAKYHIGRKFCYH